MTKYSFGGRTENAGQVRGSCIAVTREPLGLPRWASNSCRSLTSGVWTSHKKPNSRRLPALDRLGRHSRDNQKTTADNLTGTTGRLSADESPKLGMPQSSALCPLHKFNFASPFGFNPDALSHLLGSKRVRALAVIGQVRKRTLLRS